MFKIINRDTKNAGEPRKVPQQILQNANRRISKEPKKANTDATAVQPTEINPKYNKNTTLIKSLSRLYIWKQHEVPEL